MRGSQLTLILKCTEFASKRMTLVCRTLYSTVIADIAVGGDAGGGDAVAVPGAVVVVTLLDAGSVNDANRFTLLGRCLTT